MTARVLTTFTPALGTGRGLRVYAILAALARIGPVEVRYVRFGADEPDAAHRALEGVRFTAVDAARDARRAVRYATQRARGVPDAYARASSPALLDAARELGRGAGLLVGDGPVAAHALLETAEGRSVVYEAHNVESDLRHQGRGTVGAHLLRRYEALLLERCAESWMCSEHDLDRAHALVPRARLRLVRNVVDVAAIEPVAPVAGGPALLLGDFTYAPNAEGRDWLLREVLPDVWRRAPRTRVVLAGRGLDGFVAPDRRVEVRGFVDDLDALYGACSCAVAPLRSGSGSPLKVVEALAHGLPVVATPVAARGLPLEPGRDVALARDADEAAAALARLTVEPDRALGRAGRARAEAELSIEALVEPLRDAVASAGT